MEDRYLYRAKRTDNGEWVEGLLTIMWGQFHIINPNDENTAYPIYPSTICQCTGLKDKNGKLIWENDIVRVPRDEDPCVITWNKDCGKWSMNQYAAYVYDFDNFWSVELEAIGSAIDNPELLEVGE